VAGALREFFTAYCSGAAGQTLTPEIVIETLLCYVRSPIVIFLLGFASVGIWLLPVFLASQGFVLSYSMFSFSRALGRNGFRAVLALFSIRLAVLIPVSLLLGAAAFDRSKELFLLSVGAGKRGRTSELRTDWYRFGLCFVCLLLGALLELVLAPQLLQSVTV